MSEAGWLALAGIIAGLVKIWLDLKSVHKLVNSEMITAREEMVKAIGLASDLAFAKGYEKGGKDARTISADALIAAAAALPPVIVPINPNLKKDHP